MLIVVTSSPSYAHLLKGFTERFIKHWGVSYTVDIAKEGESWTAQMRRIVETMDEPYFIRLCEDFYFFEDVDKAEVERLFNMAVSMGVDRIGLQGVNEGYNDCADKFGEGVWKLHDTAYYSCSMEASIYSRDFLRKHLPTQDIHIWECEMKMGESSRPSKPMMLVSDKRVLTYTDAMRQGETRIKQEDGKDYLLSPGDVWKELPV